MHTAPNGKVYIGITCKTPTARWGAGGRGYERHPYFWSAIKKYGWENIKHDILQVGLTKEEACAKEIEYITKFNSNNPDYGYNMTCGGEVGYKHTQDSIAKISARAKRQWAEMPAEQKDAIKRQNKDAWERKTEQERKDIRSRAVRTRREKYSAEELAEQYHRAAVAGAATKRANGGQHKTDREKAAVSVWMKRCWEEYHTTHPKKKLKYRPPIVIVKLSREDRLSQMSETMKRKWQDPEYLEKMRAAADARRGKSPSKKWSLSEETKAKMRKPKSEETRRKMSEAKRKQFAKQVTI